MCCTDAKLQAKKSPLIERAKTTSVEGNKSRELMSNRRITLA
ncbi:hypothetical protein ALT1000_10220 [Alteromonas macleodii]